MMTLQVEEPHEEGESSRAQVLSAPEALASLTTLFFKWQSLLWPL